MEVDVNDMSVVLFHNVPFCLAGMLGHTIMLL